jgi:hypothetical protein
MGEDPEMRVAVVLIALCLPAGAAAQDPYLVHRDFQQSVQANEARQRDIFIQNELMGIDMRLRTDQALRVYGDPRPGSGQILPSLPGATAPKIGPFAEIPDSRLSDSNARVRAATKPRR